jgi:hypothetical protein
MMATAVKRIATIQLLGERAQPLHRFRLQAAVRQFLDAVRQPMFEEAAIVRWRLAFEEITPLLFELRDRQRLQRRNPGQHAISHSEPPLRTFGSPLRVPGQSSELSRRSAGK